MADETQSPVSVATDTASVTPDEDKSPTEEVGSSVPAGEAIRVEDPLEASSEEVAAPASSGSASAQGTNTADLAEIRATLLALRQEFESKLMYDTGKQRQLDTLHEELEVYRRGFHFQLLRPVITDLLALYTDMDKVAVRLGGSEAHTGATQEIAHFRDQVEEILRRNGVERFTTSGDEFDPKRQRVVALVETDDPTLDKRIAEHLRPGFEYEDRIVTQAEQVSAYRFVAPSAAQPMEDIEEKEAHD